MGKGRSWYVHGFIKRWSHLRPSKLSQHSELDQGRCANYLVEDVQLT